MAFSTRTRCREWCCMLGTGEKGQKESERENSTSRSSTRDADATELMILHTELHRRRRRNARGGGKASDCSSRQSRLEERRRCCRRWQAMSNGRGARHDVCGPVDRVESTRVSSQRGPAGNGDGDRERGEERDGREYVSMYVVCTNGWVTLHSMYIVHTDGVHSCRLATAVASPGWDGPGRREW